MASYDYLCARDGAVEVTRPIGTAPASLPCPECGGEMDRLFAAPMIATTPKAVAGAIDRAERTRHEPDVVTSLPRSGTRRPAPMATPTPALRRLPGP